MAGAQLRQQHRAVPTVTGKVKQSKQCQPAFLVAMKLLLPAERCARKVHAAVVKESKHGSNEKLALQVARKLQLPAERCAPNMHAAVVCIAQYQSAGLYNPEVSDQIAHGKCHVAAMNQMIGRFAQPLPWAPGTAVL